MDRTAIYLSPALIAGAVFSFQVKANMPPAFNAKAHPTVTIEKQSHSAYAPSPSIKMFSAPKAGFTQYALHFSAIPDESKYRVDVQLGQYKKVDCNIHFLSGKLEKKSLDGWGYTYWQLPKVGEGGSTRMACPPDSETNKFVAINDISTIRYNSQLPAVFYVPNGVSLRYKIWHQLTDFID